MSQKNIFSRVFIKTKKKVYLLADYINPTDPAVIPTIRKKENSAKSLGKEFTMILNRVIWPCAPQV